VRQRQPLWRRFSLQLKPKRNRRNCRIVFLIRCTQGRGGTCSARISPVGKGLRPFRSSFVGLRCAAAVFLEGKDTPFPCLTLHNSSSRPSIISMRSTAAIFVGEFYFDAECGVVTLSSRGIPIHIGVFPVKRVVHQMEVTIHERCCLVRVCFQPRSFPDVA